MPFKLQNDPDWKKWAFQKEGKTINQTKGKIKMATIELNVGLEKKGLVNSRVFNLRILGNVWYHGSLERVESYSSDYGG